MRWGCPLFPRPSRRATWGLEVLGISCIGNAAAGILPQPLLHTEVLENVRRASHSLAALVAGILERL